MRVDKKRKVNFLNVFKIVTEWYICMYRGVSKFTVSKEPAVMEVYYFVDHV